METRELTSSGGKVRLFIEASLADGARVKPNAAQSHYLLHVMRAQAGDRVNLFNGHDGEWLAKIGETTKRDCVLVCEIQTGAQTAADDLWLVFAPIKKTPADYVTQKATELGVSLLQPVITRRTIVHRINTARMRANAIEAAEQSGRLTVPDIREATELGRLLERWPRERHLLFCDETGAPPMLQALAGAPAGSWAVLTGPEGGFDDTERAMIRALPSTVPVSLGVRILRADTAALSALAIWQAQCGKG
jgi:16S rRNA (uracil1498-N3)-methyltransferase